MRPDSTRRSTPTPTSSTPPSPSMSTTTTRSTSTSTIGCLVEGSPNFRAGSKVTIHSGHEGPRAGRRTVAVATTLLRLESRNPMSELLPGATVHGRSVGLPRSPRLSREPMPPWLGNVIPPDAALLGDQDLRHRDRRKIGVGTLRRVVYQAIREVVPAAMSRRNTSVAPLASFRPGRTPGSRGDRVNPP